MMCRSAYQGLTEARSLWQHVVDTHKDRGQRCYQQATDLMDATILYFSIFHHSPTNPLLTYS